VLAVERDLTTWLDPPMLSATDLRMQTSCTRCGAAIQPATSERNGGLCAPCRQGTRESIDRALQEGPIRRALDAVDPLRKLYLDLLRREHAEGENALSEPERHYLAVALLDLEVHNGGFDQYFFNSSADSYDDAVLGLERMGARRVLELLLQAKQVLFGRYTVPSKIGDRRQHLREPVARERATELSPLDESFYREADELSRLSEAYARAQRLL
jgi:hypothetical protein